MPTKAEPPAPAPTSAEAVNSSAVAVPTTSSTTIAVENLDERMERIRLRNEQLEKKHREAEEDRLAALRNNAMVSVSRPAAGGPNGEEDDDWPRAHRYDTYEFAYETGTATAKDAEGVDTKTAVAKTLEASPEPIAAAKDSVKGPGGRDYKKFADGQGPPPDPTFNFLADADRDGKRRAAAEKAKVAKPERAPLAVNAKDWRLKEPQQGVAVDNALEPQKSRGGLNNSFKSKNNNNRGRGAQSGSAPQRSANNHLGKAENAEFSQWRSERERIDEARIGRQKTDDGKWRREWDMEKLGGEEQRKATKTINNNNGISSSSSSDLVEQRGNVTVSVSKDGEVKSVKLQSNRAIGTGRVVPRQLPQHSPLFQPSTAAAVLADAIATQPPQPHPYYSNKAGHKPLPPFIQPTPPVFYATPLPMTANLPPAARQFLESRPKLQDRLSRHRQPTAVAATATTEATEGN